MKILTHTQEASIKSDENVTVILLETPGKQASIGIVMPKKVATGQSRSNTHEILKS